MRDAAPVSEKFCEAVAEPAHLGFVHGSLGVADAFRHAADHELHHRAIERTARGRHLLHDRVTVFSLVQHALDRAHLAFETPQAGAQRVHVLLRQCKPALGAVRGGRHGTSIPRGVPLRIPPGV